MNIKKEKKQPQIKITLGLLGSSAVGKTNICTRIDEGRYNEYTVTSIGIDHRRIYREINIENTNYIVELTIVDTAGQEKYRTISGNAVKTDDIVLIVYDITNETTLEDAEFWTQFFKNNAGKENASIYLVGNKSDLSNRKVSYEEGSAKAKDLEINWGGECTCKDLNNYSLENLFQTIIIEKAKEKIKNKDLYSNIGIKLEDQKKIKNTKKGCCR